MPGLMSLRPLAATGSRRTSRLSEKVVEERERASRPNLKAGVQQHQININMPTATAAPAMNNAQIMSSRAKQVTDPWPANVRARLVGSGVEKTENYSSSGSEHEPSSNCLAAMVHEFMEVEDVPKNICGRARCNCDSGSCNGGDAPHALEDAFDTKSSLGGELAEVLHSLSPCATAEETSVLAEVIAAMDAIATGADRRRAVVKHLRARGYNAALCKSRWDHAGSFPGGDYDYIDVVSSSSSRLIIDIEFQSQFEIARPSAQYKHVYQALPAVFVGSSDRLLQIINLMSEAVKRSLKKKGMLIPPWRKPEYVKAKWFSSYKRTTNEASQRKPSPPNISLVAVRSIEWDKKFTLEMEEAHQQPEGVVRGGNRLKHLWSDVKSDAPREIQEIDNTDWELPALLPKALNRRNSSTGLTSVLREAGLIGGNNNLRSSIQSDFKSSVAAM